MPYTAMSTQFSCTLLLRVMLQLPVVPRKHDSSTVLLTVPLFSVIFAPHLSMDPSWTKHFAVLLESSTFRTRNKWFSRSFSF